MINNDEKTMIEIYLNEADKYKMSVKEQNILRKKIIKNGMTPEYRESLINSQLFFVVSTAKNYQGLGLELGDLIQYGNIGLLKAINSYDPSRNPFTTYCAGWVKQMIYKSLSEKGHSIRIPNNQRMNLIRIRKYLSEGYSIEEISEIQHKTKNQINLLLQIGGNIISLDNTLKDNEKSLINIIGNEKYSPTRNIDKLRSNNGISDIEIILDSKLKPREADIIKQRYGFNLENKQKTLQELGDKYKITRERIRQIQKRTEKKLKEMPEIKELEYLSEV